jgi:hypothetical protein
MAYRRELWRIVSGSEVRFMCNITPLIPQQHQTDSGSIGMGPHDATAPSAIMTAIFGRLGTRRLGTAFLCILL